ncbi:MAG: hypothetical protein HW416_93 [Chloroflexi bacterium]|nr:hypothetical protein [Chloroflexota bacterium]
MGLRCGAPRKRRVPTAGNPGSDLSLSGITEGIDAPESPIVVEHRGQLIYLLREAAELEHAIMCQYLFAAFTMKQSTDEGLTDPQMEAVNRWRKVILGVARQEMLHLALVQNLLTAIGAGPHLTRPNIPSPAGYFPQGVQMALIPFGERALRHFMFLERPEGMPLADAEGLATETRRRPLLGDEDIVPRAQDYATVGHLYRAIDIGFGWLTAMLGADRLFVGPASGQATQKYFGWPQLVQVVDLNSAHRAVDTIVEQGEGVRGDWQVAHFGRFRDVFDEFMALRQQDPGFDPTRPVIAGLVREQSGADLPIISDPATGQIADLFNVANEIVLMGLTRFFAHTDESGEQLDALVGLSVGMMFDAIKPLGDLLTRLPFGPSHPGSSAGPTFELFYQSGYFLPHRGAAWLLMEERLRQAVEFARKIESSFAVGISGVANAMEKHADALAQAAT